MEKPSQIICVKCGEKVIARDTWANLSDEELAFVKRKHPRMRWHADCGWNTGCGYTFGLTEQEALDAYAENQQWGMERIAELEEREAKLDALEGAGVDNWCGYDDAMEFLRAEEESE